MNQSETTLSGVPVSPGMAIGEACLIVHRLPNIEPTKISESEALDQFSNFIEARNQVVHDLEQLISLSDDEVANEIISAQIEFAKDPEIEFEVKELTVGQHYKVDYAIFEAYRNFIELIESTQNEALRERLVDISDIRDQLIRLTRQSSVESAVRDDAIVVTDELSPTELVRFMRNDIAGIVLDGGGVTSHAAIIARSLGIPAVFGTRRASAMVQNRQQVIVDGETGELIIHPEPATRDRYLTLIKRRNQQRAELHKVLQKPSATEDGTVFTLRANVEFERDVEQVKRYQAEGVGLLRTESLYLEKGRFDAIEAQRTFYEHFIDCCGKQPLTIRLFDAGGDKLHEQAVKEDNPFLGWRGIRMLLSDRTLLRDQLMAILMLAGANPGQIRILIPMVSDIEQVRAVKEEVSQLNDQLLSQEIPVDRDVAIGVMVEVPSVAIQADLFAREVDFFSIGTNDLTQYTLAVDRGNERVTDLYQQYHPAVWQLIDRTAKAAREHEIEISVCGELASQPVAAACLMGMGIRDLSMAPIHIPAVKHYLIGRRLKEMRTMANKVKHAGSPSEVHHLFDHWSE